jgi:hypothetical protein
VSIERRDVLVVEAHGLEACRAMAYVKWDTDGKQRFCVQCDAADAALMAAELRMMADELEQGCKE